MIKNKFLLLTSVFMAISFIPFSRNAYGIVIGQPTFNLYADFCLKPSVISSSCITDCPDPGDVITISTIITNDSGADLTPLQVVFRVDTNNLDAPAKRVDLFFGGATYMNRNFCGGNAWDDSYGQVVNTPGIPASGAYTVKANFSLLRQQLSQVLATGATGNLNVRVEVYSTGFITYYGSAAASLRVTNRSKQDCGNKTIQDAAPVMMDVNAAIYTPSDTIYLEWSLLAAADSSNKVPTWGDSNNGIVDIFQLSGRPTGDPEADCTAACGSACGTDDACANRKKRISSWTTNAIQPITSMCTTTPNNHLCWATDDDAASPNTFYYSWYDGSTLNNTFTNLATFPASDLPSDYYYLARMRSICTTGGDTCGSASHPVRGPQWTYFKVGSNPTIARISGFNAYEDRGHVVAEWETSVEVNTQGFYLLRLNETSGAYEQVNEKLLPALIGSAAGGVYRLLDEGAYPGETHTYKVLEVESKGRKIEHGPFTVTALDPALSPMDSRFSRKPHEITQAENTRILSAKKTNEAAQLLGSTVQGGSIKLYITENGIYYLSASDIAALMGISPQEVSGLIGSHLLSLSNMGQAVAYRAAKNGSGIFFHGTGADSIYTKENVYWLSQGRGLPMEKVKDSADGPSQGKQTFSDTLHFEHDVEAAPGMFTDPDADYWFWDYLFGGTDGMDTKSFTIAAKGAVASTDSATLSVHLKAAATSSDAEAGHHAIFSLNGTVIGEDTWQGTELHTSVISFSQALLSDGDNTVQVKALPDQDASYSLLLIDSFDVTYKRLYRAVNNSLLFLGDGNSPVTIEGFTKPVISVYEVTDPQRPKYVRAIVDGAKGSYRVSFSPSSPSALYLAVSSAAVSSSFEKRVSRPSNLMDRGNTADCLIITVSGLEKTAQSLAAYREGTGLKTMVVDLESVMDEFNHGVFSPKALRKFLSYAYKSWEKAPGYVVLAGNGTYDYKDNKGLGDNLVPPLMTATPYGLFPSDNSFADASGSSVPNMAIGRLPVASADELQSVINRIIAYESSVGEQWRKNILMTAGSPDPDAGDFPNESDSIASLVPSGYSVSKIYLSEQTLDNARQTLLAQINSGAYLLNYMGHGSVDRLDNAGLLMSSDAGSLTVGEKMPVVSAMTCFMNHFAYPGYDTLGEALVLNGAAAAVFGPTGLSLDTEAVALDRKLFRAIFADGRIRLGDAVLKAQRQYARSQGKAFMLDIYNVLGDPALRIK